MIQKFYSSKKNNKKVPQKPNIQLLLKQLTEKTELTCFICQKRITNLILALHTLEGDAHFDCILHRIQKTEKFYKNKESITYIGSGKFAVINKQKKGTHLPFEIKKEIPIQKNDSTESWQNDLVKLFLHKKK